MRLNNERVLLVYKIIANNSLFVKLFSGAQAGHVDRDFAIRVLFILSVKPDNSNMR